jgi:transcriptional regulator with XRE-family HTH domain
LLIASRISVIEKSLGQRIAELRKTRKLTQQDFAEKCGYSVEFVSLVAGDDKRRRPPWPRRTCLIPRAIALERGVPHLLRICQFLQPHDFDVLCQRVVFVAGIHDTQFVELQVGKRDAPWIR